MTDRVQNQYEESMETEEAISPLYCSREHNAPYLTGDEDYFSAIPAKQKQTASFKSPLFSLNNFQLNNFQSRRPSTGHITSLNSPISVPQTPPFYPKKFRPRRTSTNFPLYHSSVTNTPSDGSRSKTSSLGNTAINSPISSSIPDPFVNSDKVSKSLQDLDLKTVDFARDFGNMSLNSKLPEDYLNILLEKGEYYNPNLSIKDQTDKCFQQIFKDYNLVRKLIDDESDIISAYIAESVSSKQQFILRFTPNLTMGSVSRLTNSYYSTSDLNTKITSKRCTNLPCKSEWDFLPYTCSPDIEGVCPCKKMLILDDKNGIVNLYPLKDENIVLLSEIKFNIVKDLPIIITIAINILKTLKELHKYGLVINSLTNLSVLVNPTNYNIHLFGFDFSFSSAFEVQQSSYRLTNRALSSRYIPYTAPENFLGRKSVDFRADFYSVGAIVYELINGELPSKNDSAWKMIIKGLTYNFIPLNTLNAQIPIELSNIVQNLLSKSPLDRYTCVDYVLSDLSYVYQKLTSINLKGIAFVNEDENKIKINYPSQLTGRNEIINSLINLIDQKSAKTATLKGEPGVGITTILDSLRIPANINKVFFAKWRCSAFGRVDSKFDTFYLLIIQLITQTLSLSKKDVARWRDLIVSEVHADLSMLFSQIPELKVLLGSRYTYVKPSRFDESVFQQEITRKYIIKTLFKIFSEHVGLVLVIENIGSLSENEGSMLADLWYYLKRDFNQNEIKFTLLTSFTETEQNLFENANVPEFLRRNVIQVDPLKIEDVYEISRNSLQLSNPYHLWKYISSKKNSVLFCDIDTTTLDEETEAIARKLTVCLYNRTMGNPLFIKVIIHILSLALLNSDISGTSMEKLRYILNFENQFIQGKSVRDAISEEFKLYTEENLNALKFAACIFDGNSFNLYDLSVVTQMDFEKIYQILYSGTLFKLLIPCSLSYKLPLNLLNDSTFPLSNLNDVEKKNLLHFTKYTFSHELFQTVLLDMLKTGNSMEQYHRLCGLRLYEKVKEHKDIPMNSAECFNIAYHFINSSEAAKKGEWHIYTDILTTAGWSAYVMYDYSLALKYFEISKKLTEKSDTLKVLDWIIVHITGLMGNFDHCIDLVEDALKIYNDDPLDVAQFLTAKLLSLTSLNKMKEAFDVCMQALKVLDFPIDLGNMSAEEVRNYTIKELKPRLPSSPSEIDQLMKSTQKATNRKIILIQEILVEMNQPSIFKGRLDLVHFSSFQNLALLLENGKSGFCAVSLILIASVEVKNGSQGIKKAIEYCKLGFSMVEELKMEDVEQFITTYRLYCTLVGSLIEPIDKIDQSFDLSVVNSKVHTFDSTYYRGVILKFKYFSWLTLGLGLTQILERMNILKDEHLKPSTDAFIYNAIFDLTVKLLNVFTGELEYTDYTNLNENLNGLDHRLRNYGIASTFIVNKILACYILRKFELGVEIYLNEMVPELNYLFGSLTLPWAKFFGVLLICNNKPRRESQKVESPFKELEEHCKETAIYFEAFSQKNPSVFMCMYLIMAAVISGYDDVNSQIDTLEKFEKSIEEAKKRNNIFLEAIASEECGSWLRRISNSNRKANEFLKASYRCYLTWGLTVKVTQLSDELGDLLDSTLDIGVSQLSPSMQPNRFLLPDSIGMDQLDNMNVPGSGGNYYSNPKSTYFSFMSRKKNDTRAPVLNSVLKAPLLLKKTDDEQFPIHNKGSPDRTTNTQYIHKTHNEKNFSDYEFGSGEEELKNYESDAESDGFLGESEIEEESVERIEVQEIEKHQGIEENKKLKAIPEENQGKVKKLSYKSEIIVAENINPSFNSEDDTDLDSEVIMQVCIEISQSNDVHFIIEKLMQFSMNFVKAEYGCLVLNPENQNPHIKALSFKNNEVKFLEQEWLNLRGDLVPVSVVQEVLRTQKFIKRSSDPCYFDMTFRDKDGYFDYNGCEYVLCIPLKYESKIVGALYLENQDNSKKLYSNRKKIDLLEYLCSQSFISIYQTEMFNQLALAKKAAEDATAERTSFLANMSHEIRTPFNSLMSCAIFLLDTELTESQKLYVETIKNSALVTLNIIDGILVFSKLEHGSMNLDYSSFKLNDCIESAMQLVGEQVASKNLELVYINNCYPISTVYGDETRFTQVVINLLGNATKFTNKGFILIRSSWIKVSTDRYEFKISIKDTGIGIPSNYTKTKIFKEFNQVDGSSRREYGGSGLGLAISKKIAEFMGGNLTFESTEGEGSEFFFTFITKADETKDYNERINFQDNGGKVLIINEYNMTNESLKMSIERFGFENIDVIENLEDRNQKLADYGYQFVFINHTLIPNRKDALKLKEKFHEAYITLMVPFGKKIPDYSGRSNAIINFVLLLPFRNIKIQEILEKGCKNNLIKASLDEDENENVNGKESKVDFKEKLLAEEYPLNILVAEDNIINTRVVVQHLKRLGYNSDHAKDGVEVMEMTDAKVNKDGEPYDLVFMDLQMPRKDGFQATEELKQLYGDRVRVVALSANVYSEEKNKCVNIGMSGFLNKPLLPEALKTELKLAYSQKTL